MITLLSLFGLALCYNTTTMTQEIVFVDDNALISTDIIINNPPKLSIYDYKVEERGNYLCAIQRWTEQN